MFITKLHISTLIFIIVSMQTTAQELKYPNTRKENVSDNYFGTVVKDEYRWLEDDNAEETKKWVDEQNAVTFSYIRKIDFRDKVKDQLTDLWNYTKYSSPFKKGEYYYYSKNDGLQNQSVIYRQTSLNGEPELFFDPNRLSKDGTAALGSISFSGNNKYMAYSVSRSGSDWQDIYVMEVGTKRILTDSINYSKFSAISWKGDDGFYYSGYDKPKDEAKKYSAKSEFQKVFYHKIGTPQNQDKLIYEDKQHPLRYKGVGLTEDERFLILSLSEGTDGSEIQYWDLQAKNQTMFKKLLPGFKFNYEVIDNIGDKLLVYTNDGAPNYQVVLVDPKAEDKRKWETIISERKEKLDAVTIVGNQIFASYLKDASTNVIRYSLEGKKIGDVPSPGIGTMGGFGGKRSETETFYSFSSFNMPIAIYKYDIESNESTLFKKAETKFNSEDYEVKQEWFKSKDGTKVPMFIVHRKDLDMSQNHPTLMYGYGGFNISLTPSFSVPNLYFVKNGGVFVMVNLRGGSEYGEKWHAEGMLENKQNVFDDFIGAAEHLIKQGITTSEQLAIMGRSNGGLLVGACMTQRPDLFKVALPGVGVLDMLRYHKFTVGWGWAVEYGSSDKVKDFKYIYKYSPLHNLKSGTTYPATLITTGDHDDRVVPAHSFKYAAALQEAHKGENPVLIRIDKQAGHGAGKPTSKQIEEWADVLSFTMYNLGISIK